MPSADGRRVVDVLKHLAIKIEENMDLLCRVDSEVGDGDHGVSMTIGMRAARRNLDALENPTPETAFRALAEAFADEVGASIGPIYEEAFNAAAGVVKTQRDISAGATWADILAAMAEAAQRVGGAKPGDKTLVDAWVPAVAAMRESVSQGMDLQASLQAAAHAAWQGVEATKDLVPRLGRASRLGERARGFQDAGATSASIMIDALQEALGQL